MNVKNLLARYCMDRAVERVAGEIERRSKEILNSGKKITRSSQGRLIRTLGRAVQTRTGAINPRKSVQELKAKIEELKKKLQSERDPELISRIKVEIKDKERLIENINKEVAIEKKRGLRTNTPYFKSYGTFGEKK